MSQSIATKHLLRALSRWPTDALRPECQFQDAMKRRIERRLGGPSASTTTSTSPPPSTTTTSTPPPTNTFDEKKALSDSNILYSLLENRYSKTYPLPPTSQLMNPKSQPTYYEDLIRELEAAPRRTWIERMVGRWRGFLRIS